MCKIKISYLVILLTVLMSCSKGPTKLPIYGERHAITRVLNGKKIIDSVYHTIPPFILFNQDSVKISEKNFNNTIYIADFFFTSCPSICPIMHRNLLTVFNKFKNNQSIKFASHTIDVKYDRPSRLKEYANKLGVKGSQWEFLWGDRETIYSLAEKHYLVAVKKDQSAQGGFIHQGYFILIDKEKRIRGAYDGTDSLETKKMINDISILLKEYKE